jgi:hypothetical protein
MSDCEFTKKRDAIMANIFKIFQEEWQPALPQSSSTISLSDDRNIVESVPDGKFFFCCPSTFLYNTKVLFRGTVPGISIDFWGGGRQKVDPNHSRTTPNPPFPPFQSTFGGGGSKS